VDQSKLAAVTADPTPYLADPDPAVRRLAVSASVGNAADPTVAAQLAALLASDLEPRIRAEAAEVLATAGAVALEPLMAATTDPDPIVVEAVATGLGELEDPAAVPWLIEVACAHEDRLAREAAVAALGAVGDDRALPILLDLVASGPPQIRRRCVVALTVFDGTEVETAIRAAATDRNPMVREAAEMVVGRPAVEWAPPRHNGFEPTEASAD
jgi:HEAT repeat protein